MAAPLPVAGPRWLDFVNTISGHADGRWLYRGLWDTSFSLRPSVGRDDVCGPLGYSLAAEAELFDNFKLEASRYASAIETRLEWLAVGQHHGLPTRLLDWSTNPLVAAWFASEQPSGTSTTSGRIVMVRVASDLIQSGDQDPLDPKLKHPMFVRVPPRAARITSQQGLFSVHPTPSTPWDPNADGFDVHEVEIPAAEKPFFRRMLHVMGVDRARLMSDLDALCETLAWQYRERN